MGISVFFFFGLEVSWSFFRIWGYFGHLLGFEGYFDHVLCLWAILVNFSGFWANFAILKVFLSFWRFCGYFYHFRNFGEILVILLVFEIYLVILEILWIFWSFKRFWDFFFSSHLECILIILVVLRVFWSFYWFWGILELGNLWIHWIKFVTKPPFDLIFFCIFIFFVFLEEMKET